MQRTGLILFLLMTFNSTAIADFKRIAKHKSVVFNNETFRSRSSKINRANNEINNASIKFNGTIHGFASDTDVLAVASWSSEVRRQIENFVWNRPKGGKMILVYVLCFDTRSCAAGHSHFDQFSWLVLVVVVFLHRIFCCDHYFVMSVQGHCHNRARKYIFRDVCLHEHLS